eukprot:COSAG01_NODE_959_length_12451_cov_18.389815_18_plen_65_part_00
MGVDAEALEDVDDEDDVKGATIQLIIEAARAEAARIAAAADQAAAGLALSVVWPLQISHALISE